MILIEEEHETRCGATEGRGCETDVDSVTRRQGPGAPISAVDRIDPLDSLRLAVLEHVEVVGAEPGDELPLAVGHHCVTSTTTVAVRNVC